MNSSPPDATAGYFLNLFLTDDFSDMVVTQTNACTCQYNAWAEIAPHLPIRKWKDAMHAEIKKFFALHILSGLVDKSRLKEY